VEPVHLVISFIQVVGKTVFVLFFVGFEDFQFSLDSWRRTSKLEHN
jgi:hypothetical protein